MIRKLREEDIDRVMQIWLDANVKAHDFISEKYWSGHFELVKEMLPQTEVYVYEDESKEIQGFVGVNEDYIEGIFVQGDVRSQGIGKQLLEYVKNTRNKLGLSVYQKNRRAIKFYRREGFKIQSENLDEKTDEMEYNMVWEQI